MDPNMTTWVCWPATCQILGTGGVKVWCYLAQRRMVVWLQERSQLKAIFGLFQFGGAYLTENVVVAVKIENKMKEEDVLESSGQMWNKCVSKIRLDKKRKTCHFTLSSMETYLVGCTHITDHLNSDLQRLSIDTFPSREGGNRI